jgi:hypothetical protein
LQQGAILAHRRHLWLSQLGGRWGLLLPSSGQGSEMLLNILQHTAQPSTTKKYLAQNGQMRRVLETIGHRNYLPIPISQLALFCSYFELAITGLCWTSEPKHK